MKQDSPAAAAAAHGHCGCGSPPAWATYFENSRHADVTIICRDGQAIRAHKLVLCIASPYFDKALDPAHGFKEAQRNEVHLQDEDAAVVKGVLRFIYTGDYLEDAAAREEAGVDHHHHHCAAQARKQDQKQPDQLHHQQQQAEEGGEEEEEREDAAAADDNETDTHAQLTHHAAIHAAAGYFLMPRLLSLSSARFTSLLSRTWHRPRTRLPSLIARVFATTLPAPTPPSPFLPQTINNTNASPAHPPSPSPNPLRTALIDLAATHLSTLLCSPLFVDMMDDNGAFGREVAAALAMRAQGLRSAFGGRRFLCEHCVSRYGVQSEGTEMLACVFCRGEGVVRALRE